MAFHSVQFLCASFYQSNTSLRQYINYQRPKGKTNAVFLTQRGGKMDRVTEAMEAMKRALVEDGAFTAEELAGLTAKDFRCIT